jgi:hypothetical protein
MYELTYDLGRLTERQLKRRIGERASQLVNHTIRLNDGKKSGKGDAK